MISSEKSALTASKALQKSGVEQSEYIKYPALLMAEKISKQEQLSALEIEQLHTFFSKPSDRSENKWLLRFQLAGGEEMESVVASHIALTSVDKATISLLIPSDVGIMVRALGHHKPEKILLAEIGELPALTLADELQTETVLESIAQSSSDIPLKAKWAIDTVTASGHERKVVWDSPEIHSLRRDLLENLQMMSIPYKDSFWIPENLLGIWPMKPEDEHCQASGSATHLCLDWGDKSTTFMMQGEQVNSVVVASVSKSNTILKDLLAELSTAEQRWLTQVDTAIQVAARATLEIVGRRYTSETGEGADLPPVLAAVTASEDINKKIDVKRLASGPLKNLLSEIERLTVLYKQTVVAIFQNFTDTTIDADEFLLNIEKGLIVLKKKMESWVDYIVGTPKGEEQVLENSTIVQAPEAIARDFSEVVGGAGSRTNANNPKPDDKNPGGRVALGAAGLLLLNKIFRSWGGEEIKGITTNQTSPRSDLFRDIADKVTKNVGAVDNAAGDNAVRTGFNITYEWKPNYYGTIKTVHHPDHKKFFGRKVEVAGEVTDEFDGQNISAQPGDHPLCKCGWDPIITV